MKKIILFTIICIAVGANNTSAQRLSPFDHEDTVYDTLTFNNIKYVYRSDVSGELFRVGVWPAMAEYGYSDGRRMTLEELMSEDQSKLRTIPSSAYAMVTQLYLSTFTPAERALGEGGELTVVVYFDTSGNYIGIRIDFFLLDNKFSRIPLARFAAFEQAIANAITSSGFKITVAAEGKKRNYHSAVWISTLRL